MIEIPNPSIHQNASARGQGRHRNLGNIALRYIATNTDKFVHIVIGEPEAEACLSCIIMAAKPEANEAMVKYRQDNENCVP